MAVEKVLQGTDVLMRTFQVKDSAGVNIAIADIEDYNIYVYSLSNGVKTHHFNFKKTPVGDDNSIVVVDSNTIGFIVNRNLTKTLEPCRLYAEIEVKLDASASYVSSFMNVGNDAYIVCDIVESSNPLVLL